MDTAIVLFTRDLRIHDNPALASACARARQVLPVFVVDPALAVPPNRAKFLADSVAVLREELRHRGGDLGPWLAGRRPPRDAALLSGGAAAAV